MNVNLFLSKFKRWYDHRSVVFASLVLMLVPVLAVGPQLQFYSLSLIQSEAPSIYKTAYENKFFQPPLFVDWLKLGLEPQFIVMAALIALAVTLTKTPRNALVSSVIASSLVLSTADFGFSLLGQSESSMMENLVANFFGGFLVGGIIATTLCTTKIASKFWNYPNWSIQVLRVVLSAAIGIGVSSLMLFLTMVFYQPMRAELEFEVKPPVEATVLVDPIKGEPDVSGLPPAFSLAPTSSHEGKIKTFSTGTAQELWWRGLHQQLKFDLRLSLFADCYSEAEISKMKTMPAVPYLEEDVSAIFLKLDEGTSQFQVLSDSINSVSFEPFSLTREEPVIRTFSMKHDEEDNSLQFTQTLDQGDVVKVLSHKYSRFVVTAFAIKGSGLVSLGAERKLELRIGDRSRTIAFRPASTAQRKNKLPCRALNAPQVLRTAGVDLESGTQVVSALFSLKPRAGDNLNLDENVGQVLLKQTEGFLWVYDVKTGEIGGSALGKVHLLDFSQGVENLLVDGVSTNISENSRLFAAGEFDLEITSTGKVRAVGYSQASWKDSTLLNSTRWDQWGWEVRGAALAIFFGLMAAVVRLLHPWLLADEQW